MKAFIKRILHIKKDQAGFSLLELLVAIAISSIIAIGLVMTIFQLYRGHAQTSGEITVIRQVQQTGYYMSRDTHMAKEVLVDTDPDTPEVLTLTWYWFLYHPDEMDRDGEGNRVIYTLEDGRLYRDYYFADEDPLTGEVNEGDYTLINRTFIAEYIDDIDCNYVNVQAVACGNLNNIPAAGCVKRGVHCRGQDRTGRQLGCVNVKDICCGTLGINLQGNGILILVNKHRACPIH